MAYKDAAEPSQINFQDVATPNGEQLLVLHDTVMFAVVLTIFFVL
jgi:hypothetical protein